MKAMAGNSVRSFPNIEQIKLRLKARAAGILRELPGLSEIIGFLHLLRTFIPSQSLNGKVSAIFLAARRFESSFGRQLLAKRVNSIHLLQQGDVIRQSKIGWSRYGNANFDGQSPVLSATLVLKAPGPHGELGVIYSAFEYNWMRLVKNYDVKRLLREYTLVGATSWSPTDFAHLANFSGLTRFPLYTGVSHPNDLALLKVLSPLVYPLPYMACDWINPDLYSPKEKLNRSVDIIMVANFLQFKRHWLLFKALRKMRRDLRVVLVGMEAPGRTKDDLLAEAKAFGVPQKLEILVNIDINAVANIQESARVALLFSRREGACVAVTESFFADTPVGIFYDAHVGSRYYINEQTGLLLRYGNLSDQLSEFIETHERYSPRRWATANITCNQTSQGLNSVLRNGSSRDGLPWTRDIAPLCWRPRPMYVRDDDDFCLAEERLRLQADYGITIRPPQGGSWVARRNS